MSEIQTSPEDQAEIESKPRTVILDFLRHGESKYEEVFMTTEEKLAVKDNPPQDLTEKGVQQIQDAANRIVESIDRENEIVVLWSSPAWRARSSQAIVMKALQNADIPIQHNKIISSMRPIEQKDQEYMNQLWQGLIEKGVNGDMAYTLPEFQQQNDKFESYPEIKRRSERVYNWVRSIAEKIDTKGKKLHIIATSHFEFMNPVMHDIFGNLDIGTGQGIQKGELTRAIFEYSPGNGDMKISADFRGQHKEGISFDKNQRRFITN